MACELTGVNLPAERIDVAIPADAAPDHETRLSMDGLETNPVQFETGDLDEALEQEPNDTAGATAAIRLPVVLNGRIDRGGDVDRWSFDARKGGSIEFDLRAARLGSPLDSVLVVTDDTGREVARADDAAGLDTDSQLVFVAPADGRFTVAVSDRYRQRGGPTFAYRLRASAAAPDFQLTLSTDTLSVERDGTARMKLAVHRSGGFTGSIRLLYDGLPRGVGVVPAEIGGKEREVTLQFKAASDAPLGLADVGIVGVAMLGDTRAGRVAARATEHSSPPLQALWLATALPTPFKVVGSFTLPYASRGGTFTRHYSLERKGYEGPVEIAMAEKQMRHLQGVTGPRIVVPAGATEFDYTVDLPPWMDLGRTSRSIVTASALVDDGTGARHRVSSTSPHQNEQISLIISPGPLTLEASRTSITPATGRPVELDVKITTSEPLQGPVRVELVVPRHMRGIEAAPIELSSDRPQGAIALRFADAAGPFTMPLTLRATHGAGAARITSETTVDIVPRNGVAGNGAAAGGG